MFTIETFLLALQQQGIHLRLDAQQQLSYKAKRGALTADLKQQIQQHKADIVAFLQTPQQSPSAPQHIVADPQARFQPFPLTDIQEAYWLGRGDMFVLHTPSHYYEEFAGHDLDVQRLEQAWWQLVERHDMLRAVILSSGMQQILANIQATPLPCYDLRHADADHIEQHLQQLRHELFITPFQAEQFPLFKVCFTRLPNAEVRIHFSVDMLIVDWGSYKILMREWAALYYHPQRALPRLHISFRDYVLGAVKPELNPAAVDDLVAANLQISPTAVGDLGAANLQISPAAVGGVLADLEVSHSQQSHSQQSHSQQSHSQQSQAENYWRQRLADIPPAPELPLAIDPASLDKPIFSRRQQTLAASDWEKLKQAATQQNLSPTGVLLTLFAEILTTWSKHAYFTINLTLFNRLPVSDSRNPTELIGEQPIVGDFTSLTLLTVDNRAMQDTLAQRANRLQKQLWQDLQHRTFSGVRVLREINALATQQGGHTHNKTTQMPIVFTSGLGIADAGSDALGTSVHGFSQTPQVWLDCQVEERQGELWVMWDLLEALFPDGMIEAMFNSFMTLLQQLAHQPQLWQTSSLDLLPAAQRQQRAAINQTQAALPTELLHTPFVRMAQTHPERIAILSETRTLTYRQLYAEAMQVAHWLDQQGVQVNQLVPIVMEKGWEQVVGVLGVLLAGAPYVPIDADLPAERQAYLLAQTDARWILTQANKSSQLAHHPGVQVYVVSAMAEDAKPAEEIATPRQSLTDLAYVIYTSGSTGQPKGVVIDHRGAMNTIEDINQRFQVTAADRVLALSALNFDLSVYDIFGVLSVGGALVIPNPQGRRDPSHWTSLMGRHGVTLWNSVPALMQMLVEYQSGEILRVPLRLVMLSGDWIPLDLPQRIRHTFPQAQPISLGGATEASIWSIYYPITQVEPHWKSIPYGIPLRNQTFRVLNERFEDCPVWVAGRLCIGGIGLAREYWRDAEKTRQQFFNHPRSGERLYDTGDLGRYLPDGTIEFLGREDSQVKIRGYRIELGEIESHLLKHSQVQQCVVSVVGENRHDQQLVAYIVADLGVADLGVADFQVSQNAAVGGAANLEISHSQAAVGGAAKLELSHSQQGVLTDPTERLQFRLQQPALRQFPNSGEEISLPALDIEDSHYLRRQSFRKYTEDAVELSQIAQLLAHLQARHYPQAVLPKYRYASAGSLYPLQTYLYIKPERVTGLAAGTYYYHPQHHRLRLISGNTPIQVNHYDGINQVIYEQAAFALFLVAEYQAITPLYGQASRDFCLLEAGYMSQLLMMEAADYAIGLCPIGGMNVTPLRDAFALSDSQEMLHSFLGGAISPAQMQRISQAAPQIAPLETRLKHYLEKQLPSYMVPNIYMTLDRLPLTANGKIDRKALPQPDFSETASVGEKVLPSNELERQLLDLVKHNFKLEQLGVTDNFADFGTDSLDIVALYNAIRLQMKLDVTIADVFNHPTVRSLAAKLGEANLGVANLQISPAAVGGVLADLEVSHSQISPAASGGVLADLEVSHSQLSPAASGDVLADLEVSHSQVSHSHTLSYGQQALWVIYSNHPHNLAYNMAWAVTLSGALHIPLLQQAIQQLVQRHAALRSKITLHEGEPRQSVQAKGDYVWSEQTNANAPAALQHIYAQAFDLTQDPPLRVGLVKEGKQTYRLLLVMHHIFGDAESMNILGNELLILYRAALLGAPPSLPHLPVTYTEIVQEEKALLDSAEGKQLLDYWQQTLGNQVPILNLPIDQPRPVEQTYNGAAVAFRLSAALSGQIKQLAKQQHINLFPLFLSALQILLHRYSGQEDIWIGSPTSVSRHHPHKQHLVGYLANSIVLRHTFEQPQQERVTDLLSANRHTVLQAITHAAYPFMLLVKAIKPKRDLSYSPLFQVMLDFKGTSFLAVETPDIPELTVTRVDFPQMEGQFDLTFNIIEGDCFDCTLYYNTDIFTRARIEALSQHLQTLLASMVAQPQQACAYLPIIPAAELAQIQAWSQTPLASPDLEKLAQILDCSPQDCANVTVYLLDAHQQIVPIGISGEVKLELSHAKLNYSAHATQSIELFGRLHSLYDSGQRAKWQADGSLLWLEASPEAEANTEKAIDRYVYPRDDIEFRLVQLWEDLLDISPISVIDDFFEVGGDSLLGIRLLFNIEKEFGISIQIHALMQNKTLEKLACLLREKQATDEVWSPLVCLQEEGDKTPFFFVHASGGSAFDYYEIAKLMGDERPFYAIQPLGIEMGQVFHPSIEAMAYDYVEAVRGIQPRGPYLLGGWSFGGTVAFEMARILEKAGETVGLVLMVDTPEPTADVCKQDDFEFLMDRLPHYYGVTLDDLDRQDSTEEKIAYLLQEVKLSGLFTPDIDQTYANHWFDMYKHHNRIVAEYQPSGTIAANIAFLRPSEKIPFDIQMGNPSQVWRQFAQGQYEVFDAPGNHFNMISPLNTPALVDTMLDYIERWYEQCPRVQQARGH